MVRRYGERKALAEAKDWDGPRFHTAMDTAAVCRKFETTRRFHLRATAT